MHPANLASNLPKFMDRDSPFDQGASQAAQLP
jgi:hypothetical protein